MQGEQTDKKLENHNNTIYPWLNDKSNIANACVFSDYAFHFELEISNVKSCAAFKVSNKFEKLERTLLYPLVMLATKW